MLISKGELLNIELEQSAIHGTHRNCDNYTRTRSNALSDSRINENGER